MPLIMLGLLKANETMLKAVCQRLQSLMAHVFDMLHAVLPRGCFAQSLPIVPHTASSISLGTAPDTAVVYSCWDGSTHRKQTWRWSTANGGNFSKITHMCDVNH